MEKKAPENNSPRFSEIKEELSILIAEDNEDKQTHAPTNARALGFQLRQSNRW